MNPPSASFQFCDDPSIWASSDAKIVRIPAGIVGKRDLLGVLAIGLDFPNYFGWNWDALDECLRDLSWIDANQTVVLLHEDLPLDPNSDDRRIYLDILRDAATAWGPEHLHDLIVVFPTATQSEIAE